jgi:hypothetical protein
MSEFTPMYLVARDISKPDRFIMIRVTNELALTNLDVSWKPVAGVWKAVRFVVTHNVVNWGDIE